MSVTHSVPTKWIYDFSEGSRELRELLGGKGAGIAEMARVLGPDRVPAGFTITRADIELGICGERGGAPDSIRFFHRAGLDYVSCSPFRLPIARVAAAQAAISDPRQALGGITPLRGDGRIDAP